MGDSEQPRQRRWPSWMGLREPPIDPDAWMAVAKDLGVDDNETGFCAEAARIAEALRAAGIEAHQRAYVLPDRGRTTNFSMSMLTGGAPAAGRIRIAVVVHNRDFDRANALVVEVGRAETPAVDEPTPQSAGSLQVDVTNTALPDN